jgi:signal transduction histidine kinase
MILDEINAVEQQFGVLDHVPVGVFVLREDFFVLFWNSCLEDWTGIPRSKIVDTNIGVHFPHLNEPKYASRLQNIFEGGPPTIFSSQLHKYIIPAVLLPNEQSRIQHTTVTAVRAPNGSEFYALFVIQDVTDLTNRIQDYRIMRDQALAEIKERQQAEKALKYRVEFEDLITALSTHFINLVPEEIDNGINHALRAIGEFLGVDRSYIFQFSEDLTEMDNTHEWCATRIEPQIQKLKNVPVDNQSWFVKKIRQLDAIHIRRVADLPPEAQAEKQAYQARAIQSLVNVPMVCRDMLVGFLGFDSIRAEKRWVEEDILLLKIVGEIFVNALERKRAEERLKTYAAELERSNQELQNFAYIASHDLQEPLRKIQLFGSRLKSRHGQSFNEQGRDYLDRVMNAATRMQTLIKGLLTYSQVTTHAQPFVSVDLNQVISEVLSDLEVRIEEVKGQVIIGNLPGGLPTIDADPLQMQQLFQNLIGNALKYHRSEEPPIVKVQGHIGGGLCQLTIEDNGIGFDDKHLERIFRIFERLHGRDKYEGAGIGLAICRKIVKRHGGNITARSTPQEGTTFMVTLPVDQR